MKQPTPLLGGLLSLFLCFTAASSHAADPLNQWISGTFPRDSAPLFAPSSTFGADVIMGGNSFLAAGVVGPNCDCPDIIFTSSDGLHWTSTPGTDYNGVTAIALGDSGLWASNARGIASRIKQPGQTWPSPPGPDFSYFYYDITFGNGLYVAVGENWGNPNITRRTNITYSITGSSWSYALWNTVSAAAPKPRTVSVAFGNGYFLGIGRTNSFIYDLPVGTSDLRVSTMASPSLIVPWTTLAYNPGNAGLASFPPFNDVAFGNGVFVLVGTNILVVTNQTFAGNTAVGSLPVTPPTTNAMQKVFFLNGRFLAAAGAEILSSPDGYTWKNHGALATATGPKYISDVAYANGRYVAVSGTNFFVAPFTQLAAETPGGRLRITGSTGYVHQVSASTTLVTNSWQTITNLLLTNSPQAWTDPQGTNLPARFYRTSITP